MDQQQESYKREENKIFVSCLDRKRIHILEFLQWPLEKEGDILHGQKIQLLSVMCPQAFWLIVVTLYLALGPIASIRSGWVSRGFPLTPQGVGKHLPT